MRVAEKYHELSATPLCEISLKEEGSRATWFISPFAHPRIDAPLYKFLVEMQFGIHVSLHRDVMGPSFVARQLHVTYAAPGDAPTYAETFGCEVHFGQPQNKFVFDAAWLDREPKVGNEITHAIALRLCDQLMEELRLRVGLVGKVREILRVNLMRPTSLEAAAKHLNMTARTLRRKLAEENTYFHELVDELRMQVAIKYLRDTEMTIEEITYALGFKDAANFRRAFRRWTNHGPLEFRQRLRSGIGHSESTEVVGAQPWNVAATFSPNCCVSRPSGLFRLWPDETGYWPLRTFCDSSKHLSSGGHATLPIGGHYHE